MFDYHWKWRKNPSAAAFKIYRANKISQISQSFKNIKPFKLYVLQSFTTFSRCTPHKFDSINILKKARLEYMPRRIWYVGWKENQRWILYAGTFSDVILFDMYQKTTLAQGHLIVLVSICPVSVLPVSCNFIWQVNN